RRAIRTCGSRSATATRPSRPPAPKIAEGFAEGFAEATDTRSLGDTRPGHIPTPPRPRPDRARPALPQGLAALFWVMQPLDLFGFLRRAGARGLAGLALAS